jgi:hypothetical protein
VRPPQRRPPNPKQAYAEEAQGAIKKQKELIERLSKDNDTLKSELDTETRAVQRKPYGDAAVASLHDQRECKRDGGRGGRARGQMA